MEDLYKILNIDRGSTKSQIKKAYRELAIKHHPDKGGSEEEFKKISSAYSILSDDKKRQQYDQYGTTGDDQGMNMNDIFSNFGDIFGDIFGNSNPFAQQTRQNKGVDLKIQMNLTYLDVLNGVKKKIKLNRKHVCNTCSGTGGKEVDNCIKCNGSGKQINIQNTIVGQIKSVSNCTYCNGFGYSIKKPCTDCTGGYVSKEEIMEVEIPPGVETGMQLRQRGSGNYVRNGIPGDLIILLNVEDTYSFVRQNSNILTSLNISISEAILGCVKIVKSIDGNDLKLNIEPGVQSGKQYRFNNEGLPDFNYKVRGDFICQIVIHIPKNISDEEKDIIKKLGESTNFKP